MTRKLRMKQKKIEHLKVKIINQKDFEFLRPNAEH